MSAMPMPAATENMVLLKPTLHVEVIVKKQKQSTEPVDLQELRRDLHQWIINCHATVKLGQEIVLDGDEPCLELVERVDVADYTGPPNTLGYFDTDSVQLDLQPYIFKAESEPEGRRSIRQDADADMPQARVLALPNVILKDESDSLVFDDGLPSRLLRYLVRMIGMMRQPGLTLATFNWNRLCLLHGPPGSGKSTLCRALAQKLSIRLGQTFPRATLIELNTSSMLSKYFGESGKLISATFERIYAAAQDPGALICVVMDEVETIAGSRERSTARRVQRRDARHEPAAHGARPPPPLAQCDCALHQQPHQRHRPGVPRPRGYQATSPKPLPSSDLQYPPLLPQRADPEQLSQRHHYHRPDSNRDLDPTVLHPGTPNPLPRANTPHGSQPIPHPRLPRLGSRGAEVRRFQRKDVAAAADIGAGDVYVGGRERSVG
ncbi:hypothetical protein LTR91_024996 [Friedmanniomyces endolithicus]|uniref:AAA+ ATPase domain-containing protein n=1 Tax=Friedmanniomyces endolithicus TaxID=329885 RepID=A0AAN6GZL5_9PEZI|nr:hypothetical protein LTR94_015419 [Friedmanniomyces endolithicus]KAK0782742.1 hypothetical protein LTR38_013249 [Friedmanniomyces endolithicus]KAK0787467.1 hypothetical protein LTR59_010333 [Friedmanniomyces endolithicus]KAK0813739.1 hypothetical protein LTR75_004552 [Friedmanniomyces endolithicus]KAK0850149.1 hypothetical protein LTR03_004863 [Friedmanniomyces endolithicus]